MHLHARHGRTRHTSPCAEEVNVKRYSAVLIHLEVRIELINSYFGNILASFPPTNTIQGNK